MRKIIFLIVIFTLHLNICFAQTQVDKKPKFTVSGVTKEKPAISNSEQDNQQEKLKRLRDEASYYAPIRYVIVYNITEKELQLTIPQRRVEILMDEKQYSEENLVKVFELLKERFPLPLHLSIRVHTSLATIETPEEREMLQRSDDPRFAHTYSKYKKASYFRFDNGREAFIFTTSLSPYKDKLFVLKDIK